MEYALGIVATLLLGVIGWMLAHSKSCAEFHERVARLEEWQRARERQDGQR